LKDLGHLRLNRVNESQGIGVEARVEAPQQRKEKHGRTKRWTLWSNKWEQSKTSWEGQERVTTSSNGLGDGVAQDQGGNKRIWKQ